MDTALAVYFGSGRAVWRTFSSVLGWRFGSLDAVGSLLDFASGFGRSTRFTVTEIPAERVWAAEIQRDALEAIREELGAHVLVSPEDPAGFDPGRRFDVILVSSLFTHLPERRFGEWLEKLGSLLEPRGVFVFSTHGAELASEPVPDNGFLFQLKSESGKLDLAQYGSTFVTERYVSEALARHCPGWSWKRFPRGLAALQDLYVAVPEAGCDFEALELPRTLDHFVESFDVDLAGNLRCIGWVADREQGKTPERVELRVEPDGETIRATSPASPRDPYQVAKDQFFSGWGYELELRLPAGWEPGDARRLRVRLRRRQPRRDLERHPGGRPAAQRPDAARLPLGSLREAARAARRGSPAGGRLPDRLRAAWRGLRGR